VNRDMETLIEHLKKEVAAAEAEMENSAEDEGSCDGKKSPQKENNTSLANKSSRTSIIPVAWEKSLNAKKERESKALAQLFVEFKEFDKDLINQLLDQEEEIKVVRTALQKMRDNESKAPVKRKGSDAAVTPRRSKRIK